MRVRVRNVFHTNLCIKPSKLLRYPLYYMRKFEEKKKKQQNNIETHKLSVVRNGVRAPHSFHLIQREYGSSGKVLFIFRLFYVLVGMLDSGYSSFVDIPLRFSDDVFSAFGTKFLSTHKCR